MNLRPDQVPIVVVAGAVWIVMWGYAILTIIRIWSVI